MAFWVLNLVSQNINHSQKRKKKSTAREIRHWWRLLLILNLWPKGERSNCFHTGYKWLVSDTNLIKYVENSNNISCLLNSHFSLAIITLYMSIIYTIKSKLRKLSFPSKGDKSHSEHLRNNELNNPSIRPFQCQMSYNFKVLHFCIYFRIHRVRCLPH